MPKGEKPKNTAAAVRGFAEPVVKELGYDLWDVEFEKIGGLYELTVYIDAVQPIGLDDCERVSRALDPLLDRYDPVGGEYTFYVSSAGLERRLRLPEHFKKFLGSLVEVRLYKARDGRKKYEGILRNYEDGDVTVESGQTITFAADNVALVKLAYKGE